MKGMVKKISSIVLLIILLIQPLAQVLFNLGVSNADSSGRYVTGNNINDIKWKYNADRENCELVWSDVQYKVTFTTSIHSYGMNKKYYNLINKGSVFTCQTTNFRDNVSDPDVANSVNMYVTELSKSEKNRDIDGTLTGSYLTRWYGLTESAPTDSMWVYISQGGGLQVDRRINATVTIAERRYVWLVWNKGSKRPGTQTFTSSSSSNSSSSSGSNGGTTTYMPTYSSSEYSSSGYYSSDSFTETEESAIPVEEPDPEIYIPDDSKRLYIRDLYKRALLREPGNTEIEWFMDQTVQQAAINIMLSEEADSKSNANALTYKSFVEYCYNVIFGREADASAINNYAEALDNGEITKVKLIKRLINSDEFLNGRNKEVSTITLDEKLCTAVYNNLIKQDLQVIKPNNTTIKMYKDKIADVKTLDISGKGIISLSGLGTFNKVTKLLAQNNSISDVSELTKLTQLKYLNLNNNNTKSTINKVTNIKTLEELYIDNNGIQDANINTIYNLTNLRVLSLNKNNLSSLPSIKSLTQLKELYLDSNKIRNIAVVEQSNISKFSIKNNPSSFTGTSESSSLPDTIKNAKNNTSKIYTSQNYECVNCKVVNDALVLNEGKKTGTVTVKGGNADGCTFTYKNISNTLVFEDEVLADKIQANISKIVLSRTEENGKQYIKVKSDSLGEVADLDLSTEPGEPQITNLSGLEVFGNLESLDLSGNNITDFSVLSRLNWLETLKVRDCNLSDLNCLNNLRGGNGLKNLDASNNRITDISGVSNTQKLTKLLLSNNNIGDNLAPLKNLTKLEKLYIANNNVTDISVIKGLNLSNLVCSYNKINNDNLSSYAKTVTAINNISTKTTNNSGSIDVPEEVKSAVNAGNNSVEYVNCSLENNKIVLDEGEIKGKVIVKEGLFANFIVNVNAPIDNTPPEINISYRDNTETNQVEVVITSNEELNDIPFFKRSEDKKTLVKSYGYNTSELIYVEDLAGNKTPAQINITKFDNNRIPGFKVTVNNNFENNVTNEDVVVTISADVPLHKPDYGNYWTISEDGKTLTRTFDTKTALYQTIYSQADWDLDNEIRQRYINGETDLLEQLREIQSRRIDVRLEIPNIDKTAPQCGVEFTTTETTNGAVRATIWSDEKIKIADSKGIDVTETTKLGDNGRTLYGLILFYNENRTDDFTVLDLANNETAVNISVNNIDGGVDGLTSKQNSAIVSNQNTSITIKANENIALANQNLAQGKLKTQFAKTFKQVVRQARVYKVANLGDSNLGLITRIADNDVQSSEQQIDYDIDYNDTDALDVIDNAGNVDTVLYSVNTVDKEAPVVIREKDVTNEDGSIKVSYWVNENLANMEELSGWTYDEQTSTISKTFNTNTKEILKLVDLAGNEAEEEVIVNGVNKVNNEINVIYNEKTNQYLVKITADTKLQKVDGWDISEDKKTLSKYMNIGEEEVVYIEDYEGNGSEVWVKLLVTSEEVASEIKTNGEDTTTADKIIPQTGKYSLITATIILILMGLTFVTLKNYLKNED